MFSRMKKSSISYIKSVNLNYILILVSFLYVLSILFYYISFNADSMFGYLDYQIHWQSQYDLVAGKILYRDFYWEYGFLMLFLRLPFFFIFSKTFYSNFFNDFVFLPLLSVGLSVGIAKQYLNKKSLIIFLIVMLLYRLNTDFNTVRHLIPELSLITAIIGVIEKNFRKKMIGSFLLGISLISSVEYALIANVSFIIFFILFIFTAKKDIIKNFIQTFSFQIAIGSLFLLYLIKFNILAGYIQFHLEFIKAFYINSPDRLLFPRFDNLGEIFLDNKGFLFDFFVLLQRLNIYMLVPIIIFLIVWNIRHRREKWFLLNITLILYTIFAYTRTLTTPAYVHYGLTFIFLMIASMVSLPHNRKIIKYAVLAIIIWLCSASGLNYTLAEVAAYNEKTKYSVEKEYLPVAGMYLNKQLVQEYKTITSYIKNNTTPLDYIYSYPDGPYNQLTDRRSPVPITTTDYYGLVPSLVDPVYTQLTTNKPKYIIINKYNSSSYISAVNGVKYNVYSEGNDILIDGITTKIEDYIQQNYDLVKKYKIAWILKRRDTEKPLKKIYIAIPKQWNLEFKNLEKKNLLLDDSINLDVTDTDFEIYLITDKFNDINMLKIPIDVDLGLIKPFSKFIFQVAVIANNKAYGIKGGFIASDWQDIIVYIPKVDPSVTINAVMIQVPQNMGFLFWGKPSWVKLKPPTAYTLNTNLKIDDSIIPLQ